MLHVRIMQSALFRCFLVFAVLVNLTGAVLCIDTECEAKAETCCSLEAEEILCVEDHCEDDHANAEQTTPDDHCASCSHCSISVIVTTAFVEEQVVTSPLVSPILTEHTLTGWVSLPERPPSA